MEVKVLEEVLTLAVVAAVPVLFCEMVSVKVNSEGIAHSLGWGM
jgi:hypothetical protein